MPPSHPIKKSDQVVGSVLHFITCLFSYDETLLARP